MVDMSGLFAGYEHVPFKDQIEQKFETMDEVYGRHISSKFRTLDDKVGDSNLAPILSELLEESHYTERKADQLTRILSRFGNYDGSTYIIAAENIDIFENEQVYSIVEKAAGYHSETIETFSRVDNLERILSTIENKPEKEIENIFKCLDKITRMDISMLDKYLDFFKNTECSVSIEQAITQNNLESNLEAYLEIFEEYKDNRKSLGAVAWNLWKNPEFDARIDIEEYKNEKFKKLLEIYHQDAQKIMKLLSFTDMYGAFLEERVIEDVNENNNLEEWISVRKEVENNEQFLEAFDLTKELGLNAVWLVMHRANSYDIVRFLKKYEEYDARRYTSSNEKLDFKELLTDVAYEKVRKAANPNVEINNLLLKNYSRERAKIEDPIASKLSYSDLDLINDTLEFVHNIHDRRIEKWGEIETGFDVELNRAIAQGKNDKMKIMYLRRYCNEVKNRVKDEASELMLQNG